MLDNVGLVSSNNSATGPDLKHTRSLSLDEEKTQARYDGVINRVGMNARSPLIG